MGVLHMCESPGQEKAVRRMVDRFPRFFICPPGSRRCPTKPEAGFLPGMKHAGGPLGALHMLGASELPLRQGPGYAGTLVRADARVAYAPAGKPAGKVSLFLPYRSSRK